jgi:hypothetical protein
MTPTYKMYLEEELENIKRLLMAKHHDYGSNNLKKRGILGIMVRLDDKMARIDNLLKNQLTEAVSDEVITDTFCDIAGYAIQAILLLENKL